MAQIRWPALAAALALACAHTAEDAPRLMAQARAEFEEGHTEEALDKMRTVTQLVPTMQRRTICAG